MRARRRPASDGKFMQYKAERRGGRAAHWFAAKIHDARNPEETLLHMREPAHPLPDPHGLRARARRVRNHAQPVAGAEMAHHGIPGFERGGLAVEALQLRLEL